jgi:hypothetical protein
MVESSMRNLERTGRTADQWVRYVQKHGPPTEERAGRG